MILRLQNEVDWQKAIAQAKLDTFFTWKSTKRIYWTTQNILVEHGFQVPTLTPSASSESSLDTMPIFSLNSSVYEMANEFLNQNFPAMALVCLGTQLLSVMTKIDSMNQWSSRGVMLQFFSLLFLCPLLFHMFPMLYPHFLISYLLTMCLPHDLPHVAVQHTFTSLSTYIYLMSSSFLPHVI